MAWTAVVAMLACLGLLACSSPSPRFLGTTPFATVVDGRRIDVYAIPGETRGTLETQAIVLDGVLGVPEAALREDAAVAMARASPCALDRRSLKGTGTVWTGRLDCGTARAPPIDAGPGLP